MLLLPLALLIGSLDDPIPTRAGSASEIIRARYEVDLIGRSHAVFALPAGPRTITSFQWSPAPDAPDNWKAARLRLVWDGDDLESPGVCLPLGEFVTSSQKDDELDVKTSRHFMNRQRMPYRRSGRLVLDAEGPVRGSLLLITEPGATILDEQGYLRRF